MSIPRQLTKGNVAIVKAAVLAGCRAFYGYPITPASEITEAAAFYVPQAGGTFLQAESETAAINMVYGAAAAGVRVMTGSSGPGVSLMQEGISYMAGAELPCVIADIMRAGPGLGNIGPEQSDYHQVVKGGGHGSYRTLVLAPGSVQEMADLTSLAFDLADKYRNPVVLLADAAIGQMMEPVQFAPAPSRRSTPPDSPAPSRRSTPPDSREKSCKRRRPSPAWPRRRPNRPLRTPLPTGDRPTTITRWLICTKSWPWLIAARTTTPRPWSTSGWP